MTTLKDSYCIIGGGLLGLAIGMQLTVRGKKVIIFEKEGDLGLHQSGRNSGVISQGV